MAKSRSEMIKIIKDAEREAYATWKEAERELGKDSLTAECKGSEWLATIRLLHKLHLDTV